MHIQDGNRPPQRVMNMVRDQQTPGWALGLRNLYREAAAEPIPAEFAELLARLERRTAH